MLGIFKTPQGIFRTWQDHTDGLLTSGVQPSTKVPLCVDLMLTRLVITSIDLYPMMYSK